MYLHLSCWRATILIYPNTQEISADLCEKPNTRPFSLQFLKQGQQANIVSCISPILRSKNYTIVSLSILKLKGLSACSVSLCLDNPIFIWFISVVNKQCNYYNYYHYFLLFKHPIFPETLPFVYYVIPARTAVLLFFPNWLFIFPCEKRRVRKTRPFALKMKGSFVFHWQQFNISSPRSLCVF